MIVCALEKNSKITAFAISFENFTFATQNSSIKTKLDLMRIKNDVITVKLSLRYIIKIKK